MSYLLLLLTTNSLGLKQLPGQHRRHSPRRLPGPLSLLRVLHDHTHYTHTLNSHPSPVITRLPILPSHHPTIHHPSLSCLRPDAQTLDCLGWALGLGLRHWVPWVPTTRAPTIQWLHWSSHPSLLSIKPILRR